MNLGDRVRLINNENDNTYIVVEFFLGHKNSDWVRVRNEITGEEPEHPLENLINID